MADNNDTPDPGPTTSRGVHLDAQGFANYGEKKTYKEGTQNLKLSGYLKSKEGKSRIIHSAIDEGLGLIDFIPVIGSAGAATQVARESSAGAKILNHASNASRVARESKYGTKAVDLAQQAIKSNPQLAGAKRVGASAMSKLSPEVKDSLSQLYKDKLNLANQNVKDSTIRAIDKNISDLKRKHSSTGSGEAYPGAMTRSSSLTGANPSQGDGSINSSDENPLNLEGSSVPVDSHGNAIARKSSFKDSFSKQGWNDNRGVAQRSIDGLRDSTGVDALNVIGVIPLIGGITEAAADQHMKHTESQRFKFKAHAKRNVAIAATVFFIFGGMTVVTSVGGTSGVVASASQGTKLIDKCGSPTTVLASNGTGNDNPTTGETAVLNPDQTKNAQIIVNTVAARTDVTNIPRATVIALATAMTESTMRNVAYGDLVGPDSRGLFQQRDSWGPLEVRMSPSGATGLFINQLIKVPNWDTLPLTVAAQSTQRSGLPDAYRKWEDFALGVYNDLSGATPSSSSTPSATAAATAPTSIATDPTATASSTATDTASSTASGTAVVASDKNTTCDNNIAGTSAPGVGVATSGNDDYIFKQPAGKCAWCSNVDFPLGNADPWGLFKRECVSFVAWRMNQQMGWKEGQDYPFTMAKMGLQGRGSAVYWKDGLVARGYKFDNTPAVGAIAWWGAFSGMGTQENGHVGVVKEVLPDGKFIMEQYNAGPLEWAYSTWTLANNVPSGFIHVADVKQ